MEFSRGSLFLYDSFVKRGKVQYLSIFSVEFLILAKQQRNSKRCSCEGVTKSC